jgi:hypothetical protein
MKSVRLLHGVILSCVIGTWGLPTWAASPSDVMVAQRAFDDARDLFRAERFEEACAKFSLSQQLDPKLGTLLNLALCHEKVGHYALATSEFHDARALALDEGKQDRVEVADKHMEALAVHLSALVIHVAEAQRQTVELKLDGSAVNRSALDSEIPIDAGRHQVQAVVRGRAPFAEWVTCKAKEVCQVTVPELSPEPVQPTPPSIVQETAHPGRTVGFVLMGLGVVSVGVGVGTGATALSLRSKAEGLCAQNRCDEGERENSRGLTFAWVSNITLVAGALSLAGGIALAVLDPWSRGPVRATGNGLRFQF